VSHQPDVQKRNFLGVPGVRIGVRHPPPDTGVSIAIYFVFWIAFLPAFRSGRLRQGGGVKRTMSARGGVSKVSFR